MAQWRIVIYRNLREAHSAGPWGICRQRSLPRLTPEGAPRAAPALPLSRLSPGQGDPRAAATLQPPGRGAAAQQQREAWGRGERRRRPPSPSVSRRHFQKGLTQHPRRALCQNARWRPLEHFQPASVNRAVRMHIIITPLQFPVKQLFPQRGTIARPHPFES